MKLKYPFVFPRVIETAEKIAQDKFKVQRLLDWVNHRLTQMSKRNPVKKLWDKLYVLYRYVKAWATGQYREIKWNTAVLAIAGLIYALNPWDILNDIVPVIGFLDDVAFVTYIMTVLRKDIRRFLQWEKQNRPEFIKPK